METLIPKEKIYGQRFGQLLYNAVRNEKQGIWMDKEAIADILFNVENEDLERTLKKYFITCKTKGLVR